MSTKADNKIMDLTTTDSCDNQKITNQVEIGQVQKAGFLAEKNNNFKNNFFFGIFFWCP